MITIQVFGNLCALNKQSKIGPNHISKLIKQIIKTKKSRCPVQNSTPKRSMWTTSPSQIIKNKKATRPKTSFDLITRVGADGPYQFKMFLIFTLIWFYTGIILLNTNFLFYNKDFQCQGHGLLTSSCQSLVCQLPPEHRKKFIDKEDGSFQSIATQLGEYHCEDQIFVDLAQCSVYVGSLIGFLVFSYVGDNYGRRKGLLGSLVVCVVGNIMVSASTNLPLASVGLLLSGGGANASINASLCFFNQVTTSYKRQKYSILVQLAFTLGAILVTGFYYLITHWRFVSIFLITIPSLISLFLMIFYVQQTPQFLLRQPHIIAIKSLNRIGKKNFHIKNIIEQEDILSVKAVQSCTPAFNRLQLTHIDLLRFTSLRIPLILACFLCFIIYAMYYGSIMVITSLGFDIYASNFVIQLAELVMYLPVYVYVKEMKRKVMGMVSFLVLVGVSGVLILVEVPERCDMCVEAMVELVLIFVFRVVVAGYFCVFYLYINELFPTRVTGLGVGLISACGAVASMLSPLVLDLINNNVLMMIFCGLTLVGASVITLMPETRGKEIEAEVEEIKMLKEEEKAKSLISGKSSFAKVSMIKCVNMNEGGQKLID